MKNIKLFKSILASALAAFMLFASSCGNEAEQKTDETKPTETVSATEELTVSVPESDASAQEAEISAVQTAVSQETTSAEETTAEKAPATTEEIVALFNKSANRIKTEAVKVTKNYEKRTVNEDKLDIPDSLESAARNLLGSVMKDDTDPIVYDTKEDIRENFLVPEQDYVSKLDAADVLKATCTDNGKEYEIYMLLKTQKNPTAGVGIGAVCDVIEAAEVAEGASFVEEFSTEYYNCEVRATIDKASGKVIHANYTTPLVLKVRVNMFGTHNAAVGFTFEKDYTVTY